MARPKHPSLVCIVDGCNSLAKTKGLCGKHYKRQWRHDDPLHTELMMNDGMVCNVLDCTQPAHAWHLCKMHYQRFNRYGRTQNIVADKGKGRPLTGAGYVLLTIDGQRKYEHIYKAEQALGKPLSKEAVVHHMNNIPWDNDTPFNLVVCPDQAYHLLLHRRMKELAQREGTK